MTAECTMTCGRFFQSASTRIFLKLSCHVFSVRGVWTGLHAVLQLLAESWDVQVWRWFLRHFGKDPILRSFLRIVRTSPENTLVQTDEWHGLDMPWRAGVRCTTLTPGYPWHATHAATVVNIASPLITQSPIFMISLLMFWSCSSNISTFLQQYWHINQLTMN